VPKATKRERQRINRELRREAMRRAEQRQRRFRMARNVGIATVIVGVVFAGLKLVQGDNSSSSNAVTCATVKAGKGTTEQFASPPEMTIDQTSLYVAEMDTSCGTITIGLNAVTYPVAVNNFVFLAQQKFYNGLDFTRVVKGFAIQGGSPDNSGNGGPGYSVVGELPTGQPPYPVGAFAMAKTTADPVGTAGSQFFVVTGKNTLTADYAYVGQVTKGMKVVQKIDSFFPTTQNADGTTSHDGKPTTTVKINKVTITVTPSGATTTTAAPTTTIAP
jgi:cyclophilin family peptidyl-prolyl cis-trans isomerase